MAESSRERVAARVARLADVRAPTETEGVLPLNPGYFEIERMRTRPQPKLCAQARPKLQASER